MTVTFSGVVKAGSIAPDVMPKFGYTAGEDLAVGEMLCKSESEGWVYKAQANLSTRMPAIGCVVQGASAGGTVYGSMAGIIRNAKRTEDFGYDDTLYVSETPGKITKNVPATVGNFVQIVGRSLNASDFVLDIDGQMVRLDQV